MSTNRDIEGLRNHLFSQLERLGDEDVSGEELENEIRRGKAISEVAGTIIETAKAEFRYMQITEQTDHKSTFMPDGTGNSQPRIG